MKSLLLLTSIAFLLIISHSIFHGIRAEILRLASISQTKSKENSRTKTKIINLLNKNYFFTGREKEINALTKAFAENKNNIFVLEGISGIGKTQIAKQYAYDFLDKYEIIWWFDSEKNRGLQAEELLKEILSQEGQPYYPPMSSISIGKRLRDKLSSLQLNWLLIFDDFENMASITQYAPLNDEDIFTKHVIVTSKKMNSTYPSLVIHRFQRKESIAFLQKILTKSNVEDIDELAETLGDFPLALAQAASYIKMNPSVDIKIYLQLFKESCSDLWRSEEKMARQDHENNSLIDHYNKTIGTTIKININGIKDRSPLAYELLCFSSLFNHQHIPLELLEIWAYNKRGASKLEFHEALSLLLNYFLIEQENKAGEEHTASLLNQHEMIQLIVEDCLSKKTKEELLKESVSSVIDQLSSSAASLFEQFKEKEFLYDHIKKMCHLADVLNLSNQNIIELKISFLYFVHFIKYDFEYAATLMNPVKDLLKSNIQISPLSQIWFYCIIINDRMFEDFSATEDGYRKVLLLLEEIKDQEKKITHLLHADIDYIESLSNFGKIKEATSICDSRLDTIRTTKNKSEKIALLSISALVRLKHGQYEQALKDIEYCETLISKYKDMESYIPFLLVKKAHALLYTNQVQEAYQIIEDIYPHLLEMYVSPENIVLIRAQFIKGACLAALGKLDEAQNIVQASLSSYEKTSGFMNDSLKGMGYRILGEIFEAKENFKKAYEEYIKAEKFYEQVLQRKDLDDLSLLYARLAILGAKQRDYRQVDKYLSLHIKQFGLAHPRTFEIKRFLDDRGFPLP